ncbi:MAG: hypothetical protein MK110_05390 [Fuerstiella sp.]|nr:hypothetical protein [Fuerstiella sp.]
MLRQFAAGSLVFAMAIMFAATQADAADKKFSAKCPISGGKAKESQAADFKGGKVYFCCGKCKAAFEKDSSKHTAKAHAQLVATGQYEQKKCPLSGGPLKTTSTVGGVEVKFCCGNCKKKVDEAEGADKFALVFSDRAFKKGFVKTK